MYHPAKSAAKYYCVNELTLRRWAASGKINWSGSPRLQIPHKMNDLYEKRDLYLMLKI